MLGTLVYRLCRLPGYLLRAVAHAVDTVIDALHWKWIRRPRALTGKQQERFDVLKANLDHEPFDEENPRHVELLRRLWVASSFPEAEFATTSVRWSRIGFQSDQPARDVRGGGILSLRCLVHFAETYPDEYARLSKERQMPQYYPWSASFINVSFALLVDVLGMRSDAFGSQAAFGFCKRVEVVSRRCGSNEGAVEAAFVELACETMVEIDRVFEADNATYFEFPRVRAAVLQEVMGRLGHRSYDGIGGAVGIDTYEGKKNV